MYPKIDFKYMLVVSKKFLLFLGIFIIFLVLFRLHLVLAATSSSYTAAYSIDSNGLPTITLRDNSGDSYFFCDNTSCAGSGQIAPNTTRFSGSEGPSSLSGGYIDVNDCNPTTKAIWENANSPYNPQTISNISLPSNTSATSIDPNLSCTSQSNQPTLSKQDININIVFVGVPVNNENFGPVIFTLTGKGSSNSATINSNSQTANESTITLSGKYSSITPGNYSVCLQNTSVCQNITSTQFIGPITVDLNDPNSGDISKIISISNPQTSSANSSPSCESSSNSSLSWILCPVINWIVTAEHDLENEISNLLTTKPINFQNLNNSGGYSSSIYSVWNSFRTIANILLVIIILIIVFAESIGGGLIDAYSIRKIMPRLLIVAILINLSIYIVSALEDIFNIFGKGIGSLLVSQFTNSGSLINLSSSSANIIALGLTTTTVIGLIAIDGPVLLLTVLSAFIALFVAVITILLRQALLVFLIITSPVAFALYILPNTEQYFKKWWDLLIKTLAVYPIIMIVFALCDISGWVFSKISRGGILDNLLSIIAVIIPLFLIPFAFKIAGGAIGGLHGTINGFRSKLPVDNFKKNQRAKRMQKFETGGFQDRGIGKAYNRVGRGAKAGWRGRFGFGAVGRSATSNVSMSQIDEILKNNPFLATMLNNDDDGAALMALGGDSRVHAEEMAKKLFTDEKGNYDAVRAKKALDATAAIGYSRANARAAMIGAARNKFRSVGLGRQDLIEQGIANLAGGNQAEATALRQTQQYISREAGRDDLGGMQHLVKEVDVDNLAASMPGGNMNSNNRKRALRQLSLQDALNRVSPQNMVTQHDNGLNATVNNIEDMLKFGNDEQKTLAATHLLELHKNRTLATDSGKKIINDALMSFGINLGDPMSISQQIVDKTGVSVNSIELERRSRVYESEQAQRGGNGINPQPPQNKP